MEELNTIRDDYLVTNNINGHLVLNATYAQAREYTIEKNGGSSHYYFFKLSTLNLTLANINESLADKNIERKSLVRFS